MTPTPPEEPACTNRPVRILIAEDDPGMRELIADLVRNLGYDTVEVPDGAAALTAVAAALPDLIISDLVMPGLGGFEVCRRLKADPATRLIPVILVTGIGDEHKRTAMEAGADDFLGKPFSLGDLRARIHAVLGRRGLPGSDRRAE
jgi:CheY-like chemotaxis protein